MPTGTGTVSLTTSGATYTQNFDTLSNTASSTTNNISIPGWYTTETGGGARDNEQYGVDTGGSNTGDTFSYGASGATDRALGSLRSGTLIATYGAQFGNDSGGAITSLTIGYTGELWRLGTTGRADRLDFQISYNATGIDDGTATWVDIDALDFSTPNTTGTAGARDGNLAANQTALSAIISGLNIPAGATFWIRWIDTDGSGADDGLAIDNFSITPTIGAANPAGELAIADASVTEGNAGTTDLVFTVTRTGGSTGAVSATWTATFGTADAGDLGAGAPLTGTVNFADGATTAEVRVAVQGDTAFEPNETLTVALSGATGGATLGDATATGTITNDDLPPAGQLSVGDATVAEGNAGTTDLVFTVTRANGAAGAVNATWTITFNTANAADLAAATPLSGTVSFADGATTAEIRVPVQGDVTFEPDETLTVTLSDATGGATLLDGSGAGTITNDDAAPGVANVWINEIHYDNSSTDIGEAIEIAGVAGTDLTGYRLVLYNGTNTPGAAPTYGSTTLSGVIDDESNGFGAVAFSYPANGLQNGPNDGIALIDPSGRVVQFLSYGGTPITAAAGTPAAGVTSTDIGVQEVPVPGPGVSLQLTGAGSSYGDFTWATASDDNFGTINTGQSFLSATGTGQLSIRDAQVTEGDSGTSLMTFTIQRAGGYATAATVEYSVTLNGTADAADFAAGGLAGGTISFAAGETSRTITVAIAGDTNSEFNENFTVTLGATTGDVAIVDGAATGTIVNDDPLTLAIGQIQGAGHVSEYVGQTVITTGVVTAVDTNGFYLQSAVGDGNAATSDGIFIFTSTAPAVVVGNGVTVRGTVAEFQGAPESLSLTQLTAPTVTVDTQANVLPAAILIGTGGLLPPTEIIDNDGLTSFDPLTDGADFWESLEGMRVTLDVPLVVSNTNGFGETDVVVSGGTGATGINDRGGITVSPGDFNPEKIQIDDDSGIFAGFDPGYTIGDRLSSVTGVLNYGFNNYELVVTEAVTVTQDVTLPREATTLRGDANYLTIATYNVENLDPGDNKYDILADDIVYRLGAPDIIAVQEIQDANGAAQGGSLSGTVTAQGLIDAIFAESGVRYGYVEVAPGTANSTGGEPGGNIRNGYLYNLDRVTYVEGSATLITGPAYNGSRNPLAAQFTFAGSTITTINLHSTSRGGSDPLWGDAQPPANAGEAARAAQAAGVLAWVNERLATDPSLNFAVLGDLNGFYFENEQLQLTDPGRGGVFTNLNSLLPEEERYSYMFEGNAQQLDNILVTGGLLYGSSYDAVHINSQFGAGGRATDHDPQVARILMGGRGDSANNTLVGTPGPDFFNLGQGGEDNVSGLGGNDSFYMGAALSQGDVLDGGEGSDVVAVQGNYAGYTFGADNLRNVETLAILSGSDTRFGAPNLPYSYNLTTVDANVAAGQRLTVTANGLQSGESLTFNGAAETDGSFLFYGGLGTDTLTGGAQADAFLFGNGGQFQVTDRIAGGGGSDALGLQGDYSTQLVFTPTTMTGIETLALLSATDTRFGAAGDRYSYTIVSDDANVAAGQVLTVNANTLESDESASFDGSAETDGSFRFFGGAGNDVFRGGAGDDLIYGGLRGDTLAGGGGNDRFVYLTLDASNSTERDGIQDFTLGDIIDLSAIDANANTVGDDAFTFVAGTAFSGTAGELRVENISLGGPIWLVQADVDGDGVSDLEIVVVTTGGHTIVGTDFWP